MCRFYIPPAQGDSHFFGRGQKECDDTAAKFPTFVLEDPAFMQMFLPVAGVCPANTTEVYRVFSNRADANHRYMTDKAIRRPDGRQGLDGRRRRAASRRDVRARLKLAQLRSIWPACRPLCRKWRYDLRSTAPGEEADGRKHADASRPWFYGMHRAARRARIAPPGSGIPVSAGPVASFSRDSISFGRIRTNIASDVQPAFVTNAGDATLTISGGSIGGANAGDFSVAGTCTPPLALPPNARCRLEFKMLAAGENKRFGAYSMQSDSSPPPPDIALSGMMDNLGPYLPPRPTPGWLDFPGRPLGMAATPQTMTLSNYGDVPFNIDSIGLVGGNSGDFSLDSTCIPGGKFDLGFNCNATIGFMPSANGPRSTELQFGLSVGSIKGAYAFSVTGIGGTGGPAATVTVVEFYNVGLDHYFITWGPQEIATSTPACTRAGRAPARHSRRTRRRRRARPRSAASTFRRHWATRISLGGGRSSATRRAQSIPISSLEDPAFMHMFLPVAGVCPAARPRCIACSTTGPMPTTGT